jgi:hypothetical protein
MIDRHHDLTVTRQAELLGMSRGSVYYLPRPVSEADLALMRRLDELHLEHPFMGARMLRDQLLREGIRVGRKHVTTLMQRMGITALAPQPGTSQRAPGHKIYPYLLRTMAISRPNQVWALDTSAPWRRGLQQRKKGVMKVSRPSWLVLDWRLRYCLAPMGIGRKGAAKLGRLPTAGCHAQSSLNCTGRGPSDREPGYHGVYGETTKRASEASVFTATPLPSRQGHVARSGWTLCFLLESAAIAPGDGVPPQPSS